MRILIVEDDVQLGAGLKAGLRQAGLAPDLVGDVDAAEHALGVEYFDLVVLDLGLPGRDGLDLLHDLRRRGLGIPVLVLTARDDVGDRVRGLDAGADDYLIKPFDLDELNARIRALMRRSEGRAGPVLEVGDLRIDPVRHQVSLGDRTLDLSAKEYALLYTLARHPDRTVTRALLRDGAYAWSDEVESNALEVHIHNLRRKLGRERIQTQRGVGYRLLSRSPE